MNTQGRQTDHGSCRTHLQGFAGVFAWVLLVAITVAWGQSSSLYVDTNVLATVPAGQALSHNPLSPTIDQVSLAAVRPPEPRQYGVHDLITIIVRESTQNDSLSSLKTKKNYILDGELADFPNLRLDKLLQFQLKPSALDDGNPTIDLDFKKTFNGDGRFKRKDSFTTRITAEIIDVKPNGTLVLEARKYFKTSGESLQITLTGICRKEDVTVDNTVLSTQLFDLRLEQSLAGELRRTTKRGILSRVLDRIFNF